MPKVRCLLDTREAKQQQDRQRSVVRSARTNADGKNCECQNKSARSGQMIAIPTMLLRAPVIRKGFRRPFGNPVVDGYGSDEGKQDSDDLDCESDGALSLSEGRKPRIWAAVEMVTVNVK